MPDFAITLPDGTEVVVSGNEAPNAESLEKIYRDIRKQRSDDAAKTMNGKELFEFSEANPHVELPNEALRKIYDYEKEKKWDWWKAAKQLPGAFVEGAGEIIKGAYVSGTEEIPALLGQATVDPKAAAAKGVNTMAEAGLRMSRELEMMPPVNLAYRKILDANIPSFKDWGEKHLKTLKGQLPYDIESVEQLSPDYFKRMQSEYAAFEDGKKFQNWKEVHFKRQADRAKAASVERGDSTYLEEASGGATNLRQIMGSDQVMNKTAQLITDTTGPDVMSVLPVGKLLGGKGLGKTPGKIKQGMSKAADTVLDQLHRLGNVAEVTGKNLKQSEFLTPSVVGHIVGSTGGAVKLGAGMVRGLGDVAGGMSIGAAARKARVESARKLISAFDNEFVEKALNRFANGIEEGITGAARGAAVGSVMAIGSKSEEEFGGIVGAQAGYGSTASGAVGVSSRALADLKVANKLLSRMDPAMREELLYTRMAVLSADGGAMAQQRLVQELADVMRVQENLAHDGDTILLMTPEEIAQTFGPRVDKATLGRMVGNQGFLSVDPTSGRNEIVINTAVSANLAKTAMHEVMHGLRHSEADLPPALWEQLKAAYRDDSVEPRTLQGELSALYNDTFGTYDDRGQLQAPGIITPSETENLIRDYLGRLHSDPDAVNQAMTVEGRPMTQQELIDAYGDELFSAIAEDLDPATLRSTRPGVIVNAYRATMHKIRQVLGRKGINPERSDALDIAADNPAIRKLVRDYLKTRKKLTTALTSEKSPLDRSVTVSRVLQKRKGESNDDRKARVNNLAGTGLFKLDEQGEVLNTEGVKYQGEADEKPAILSTAEQGRMRRNAAEAINTTLEALGDQEDGMFQSETRTGGKQWAGVPNQAQLNSILALPDSVVPVRLKETLQQFVNAINADDGGATLGIDYNKALTGRRYDTRAQMKYEHVAPYSLRITQAGNFNAQILAMTKIVEKMQNRLKQKPDWFKTWADENDPTGQAGFIAELRAALGRQRRQVKNTPENTTGYFKMLEFLQIKGGFTADDSNPKSLIQSRRIDRTNSIRDTGDRGFKIDYGRYRDAATFQQRYSSFQPLPTGDQVDPLVDLVRNNPDGFTMNLKGAPADGGYVVAPDKGTEWFVTEENLTQDNLLAYLEKHSKIFEKDGAHLGGWYDTVNERYVLDAVFPLSDIESAVRTAIWADQDAIFDLNTFEEIRTKDENKQPIVPGGFPETVEQILQARPAEVADVVTYASARRRRREDVGEESGGSDQRSSGGAEQGQRVSFSPADNKAVAKAESFIKRSEQRRDIFGKVKPEGGFDRDFHINTIVERILRNLSTEFLEWKLNKASSPEQRARLQRLLDKAEPARQAQAYLADGPLPDLAASLPNRRKRDLISGKDIDPLTPLREYFQDGEKRPLTDILREIYEVDRAARPGGGLQDVRNLVELVSDLYGNVDQSFVDEVFNASFGMTRQEKEAEGAKVLADIMNPEFNDVIDTGDITISKPIDPDVRFMPQPKSKPDTDLGSRINRERLAELGFTTDIREAGYLTTDGKYIDLSGKREGGQPGTRSYDHREAGDTSGMMEFMAEGNIRLSPEGGMLDIMRQPTPAQEIKLKSWIDSFDGEVVIDLSDGLGKWDDRNKGYIPAERRAYLEFPDGTKPAKVLGMVRRFYSGEDIASGIRFQPTKQDAEYLKAVDAGDMETAQRMVDEAAKKAGYTVEAWHVTNSEFDSFDPDKAAMGGVFWFTESKAKIDSDETGAGLYPGKQKRVLHVYLDTRKSAGWDEYEKFGLGEIERRGFKSIKLEDDWIVFDPNQIKLADPVTYDNAGNVIPLSQRFDPTTPDIRFSPSRTTALKLLYGGEQKAVGTRLPDAAAWLQQEAAEQWGRIITSKDITPDEIRAIVDNGIKEVEAAMAEEGHAADWYTTAVQRAVAIMGVLHPEISSDAAAAKTGVFTSAEEAKLGMMLAMAITSQGQTVQLNTRYAEEQFDILKRTGKFDTTKDYGESAEPIAGNLALANDLVADHGWSGLDRIISADYTVAELRNFLKAEGIKTNVEGKVDDIVQGALIFGPKIGQGFLQNLRGRFDPVTVDLWMRRTWGRWTGDVVPSGFSSEQIGRLLDVSREAKIKLPDALKTLRAITVVAPSTGGKRRAVTDKTLAAAEQNAEAVYGFAAELNSKWQKDYQAIKSYPVNPDLVAKVNDGSMTATQFVAKQRMVKEAAEAKWNKAAKSTKAKWNKAAKEKKKNDQETLGGKNDFITASMERAGHTVDVSNVFVRKIKPAYARAAESVLKQLKPIDGPSGLDRKVISQVVNGIREGLEAKGHRTTNADIQALLWYPEKDIWDILSDREKGKLNSAYDTEFQKIAEARGLGEQARAAFN